MAGPAVSAQPNKGFITEPMWAISNNDIFGNVFLWSPGIALEGIALYKTTDSETIG